MQTRAVIKAALNVSAETGHVITPHIMIPLVGEVKELKFVKDVVVKVADELIAAAAEISARVCADAEVDHKRAS